LGHHLLFLLGMIGQELRVLRHRTVGAHAGQLLMQRGGGQVRAVGRGTGLLPPRLVQTAVDNGIET